MAKIRQGFVSNSSSSSFIVDFPEFPSTREKLKKMMGNCAPDCDYGGEYTSEEVVDRVWRDIQNSESQIKGNFLRVLQIDDKIEYDWENEGYESSKLLEIIIGKKLKELIYQSLQKYNPVITFNMIKKEINNNLDKLEEEMNSRHVIIFEYGDENGEGALEHGEIFRNLKHTRESKH
ncbi:MAG: hypothetical protein H8D97_01215 [Proteobacteria bacterium]|nr:hypothetical protein [Pseudomonadota bacterium]